MGISVNQAQTYRVCQAISLAIDPHQLHSLALAKKLAQPAGLIYGMVDGNMLPINSGWQETKLGRVLPPLIIGHRLFGPLSFALST